MRTFEPDPPILTPRISGLVHKDGSYRLSILKSANGNAESTQRFFYEYPQPVAAYFSSFRSIFSILTASS